jgi:putative transposase
VRENKVISLEKRAEDAEKPFFEQLLQEGARKLLQAAIENEIIEYIQFHQDRRDEDGQRLVVRNGHLPEREIVSGVGPIKVRQPRVRHRDGGQFSSAILPKYMRRTPSVDALIPALYLKGISTGDFSEALAAILGEQASGLSATNIVRLKAGWEDDYKVWCQRDLSQKRYVYWWADGIYFNVRLDEERSCVLVLIGATEDGTKELLAVVDGYRESAQSWRELLGQLKRMGLSSAPKLAIGDGSWVFGLLCRKNMARSPSNAAGCIRPPNDFGDQFPLRRRQCFWASRPSLKTMVSVAIREPDPLVRWVRNRTVAKVDSIGLVVRKCDQCWAGKS